MIPEVEKQMCVTVENMIILLTNYTDKACWKRAVFFAEVCLNWIEELDPGNEYVKETRKGIDEFYNDSENAKWKEVNENLTERNDVEDRQGVQRIHIGFDTPGQDPGTWFTGIDKALFEKLGIRPSFSVRRGDIDMDAGIGRFTTLSRDSGIS